MGYQVGLENCAHFLRNSFLATTIFIGTGAIASADSISRELAGIGVWYLRGDVSYNVEDPYEVSSESELERTRASGSIGFGFRFNDYFRLESEFGFIGQHSFREDGIATRCAGTVTDTIGSVSVSFNGTAPCTGANSGETSTWDAMLNAHLDLGDFGGFQPYIGGGVGFAISSHEGSENVRDCQNLTATSGPVVRTFTCPDYVQTDSSNIDTQYSFMWSIGAGFAYSITREMSVDVGYRYLSAPNSVYIANENDSFSYLNGVDTHQVRVGLRYEIW